MNKQPNSWLEWINVRYAYSAHDQLIQYATKNNHAWGNRTIANAILNDFHHGVVPEIRRMESPMF